MTKLSDVRPERQGFNKALCLPEEPFNSNRCARRAAGILYSRVRDTVGRKVSPEWVLLVFVHDNDAIIQVDLPGYKTPGMMAMRLGSRLSVFQPECFAYAQKVGENAFNIAAQMFDRYTCAVSMDDDSLLIPTHDVDLNLLESFWSGVSELDLDDEGEK